MPNTVTPSGGSAQARLAAALDGWRRRCGADRLPDQLAAFAGGAALTDLPELQLLFDPAVDRADRMLADFVTVVCKQLSDFASTVLPLRHVLQERFASLVLARHGSATLTIQALGCGAYTAPDSIIFAPQESFQRIMKGEGQALLVESRQPFDPIQPCMQRHFRLRPGDCHRYNGKRQAMAVTNVDEALLVLKLQRACPGFHPARVVDVRTGAVLRQAASQARDTRIELSAAVLHAMDRTDAAPMLGNAALGPGGAEARWQALRHCLALDSGVGLAVLAKLAARTDDVLQGPAARLRDQLGQSWLAVTEQQQCRLP